MVLTRGLPGLVVVVFCSLLVLAGCLAGEKAPPPGTVVSPPPPAGPEPAAAPLPVAVFLAREGKLEAVFRSLPVSPEEGPRAALEALVGGPTSFETRQGFAAVLPPSTAVRGVTVADGVATADFSREIVTRSGDVGGGSLSESLALHAIYLTLAQFPDVERVKVLVEGQSEGTVDGRSIKDFWGHLGLPEYLEGAVPVLRVAERQEVGDQEVARQAGGLRLKSLHWWAHPTLFRVVFALEGAGGTGLGGIPAAQASCSSARRTLFLAIPAVKEAAVPDLAAGQTVEVNDWRVEKLVWEKASPCSFRLALHAGHSYGWRLWGLTDPARIVLDVYATGPAPR
ncbi:MAG: GerMN domain-containing protein [Bacillota bacterium]|nr:GerMN domain-containing protein [Bacillota bacterium]